MNMPFKGSGRIMSGDDDCDFLIFILYFMFMINNDILIY